MVDDQIWRHDSSGQTRPKEGTANVSRNITARGLAEAHAEFFPGDRSTRENEKRKPCDR